MYRNIKHLAYALCFGIAATGYAQEENTQMKEVTDVSFDDGQTIAIPAGADLLQLTVAVPETVIAGQHYKYRVRLENVSGETTLANLRLYQHGAVDIDNSEPASDQMASKAKSKKESDQKSKEKSGKNSDKKSNKKSDQKSEKKSGGDEPSHHDSATSWSFGTLAPGESKELSITAVASETGQAKHCFAVDYQEMLCAMTSVVKPAVKIVKTGPERAMVCEVFEYKYELTNTGTGVAEDFVVRDDLPKGLLSNNGDTMVEFRVPQLAEGETKTFIAPVHSMQANEYTSRAKVKQKSGATSQSAKVTTQVLAPELEVEIAGPRAIESGNGGTFDVTVRNTSDHPAKFVSLIVEPDPELEVTNSYEGDARDGGKSYIFKIGDLAAGEDRSVTIAVDSESEGELTFNAKAVSRCALDSDLEVASAEADISTKVLRITSLLLTVVDTDDVIAVGNDVTYQIRVKNQGSYADKNVELNLQLPSGLKFSDGEGASPAAAKGQTVSLEPVEVIEPGETLEWWVTTTAESEGEKIVKATLNSDGLKKAVTGEELSTIFDASRKEVGNVEDQKSDSDSSSKSNSK